jgi:hypothetical protein
VYILTNGQKKSAQFGKDGGRFLCYECVEVSTFSDDDDTCLLSVPNTVLSESLIKNLNGGVMLTLYK